MDQQRARTVIDDIFRKTRLNDDESFWGDRYKDEILRFTKILGTSYYAVFSDLGVSKAMARCAVNAKYDSDDQRWIRQMDEFDRAITGLDRKDQARYYFAKGLLILQSVSKIQTLPQDFFKAAENGYSSAFLAEYIVPGSDDPAKRAGSINLTETLLKLAESYRKGNEFKESFKFYLLAAKSGMIRRDIYLRMTECAHDGGNDSLALAAALVFLESFPLSSEAPDGNAGAVLGQLPANAAMTAEDIWRLCGSVVPAITSGGAAGDQPSDERMLGEFDSRCVQPLVQNLGIFGDYFETVICLKYWDDSTVVTRFLPRVNGPVNAPWIDNIATRLRDDPRYNTNASLAQWEMRRWKEANRLEEFQSRFPLRYRLAGAEPRTSR